MDIFLELIKKNFIDPFWSSIFFWRSISLIFLIIFIALFLFKKKLILYLRSDEKVEYDKTNFKNSDIILDEVKFYNCCFELGTNTRLTKNYWYVLMEYINYFDQIKNQYFNQVLQKKLVIFHNNLKELLQFTGKHFFDKIKSADDNFYLYPDLRHIGYGEKAEIYNRRLNELNILLDKIEASYKDYRTEIKKTIFL